MPDQNGQISKKRPHRLFEVRHLFETEPLSLILRENYFVQFENGSINLYSNSAQFVS